MATTLQRPVEHRPVATAAIDCDIHCALATPESLDPYLAERWRRHRKTFGARGRAGAYYPRLNRAAARTDSWPPSGQPPGSDLGFMREQLLDRWGFEYGVLTPLFGSGGYLDLDFGAAMASAINDWQAAEWVDPEPRLRGSVAVAWEDADLAAAEIERRAADPRFVQLLTMVRTSEPMGRRRYWKMYAAAEAAGLPIGIHFGGTGGAPITGAGFPSFYIEDHCGVAQAFQAQVISLICEGVFARFPRLRFVLIEGGFAWLPPLLWRLDRAWRLLRAEVPELTRLPSEYAREHLWLTTQPMEEPHRPADFHGLLRDLDADDRLMFATDYPHWDFDAPDAALPVRLEPSLERKVMAENARALYRLPVRAAD